MIFQNVRTHSRDWGVSIYTYPDSCEATAWKGQRHGNKKGKQREAENREEMTVEVKAAAISRARKTVRVKCASIGADHMLTLTYRENMTDLDKAWNDFKKLIRKMRKDHDWKQHYIAVAEQQKRGAWHFHVALAGRQNVKKFRDAWRSVIGTFEGMPGGNIDLQGPNNFKKMGITTAGHLASYLSKYITKDSDSGQIGSRRYRTSLNIPVDKRVKYVFPFFDSTLMLIHLQKGFKELTGFDVNQFFESRDGEIIWLASWASHQPQILH